MGKQLSALALSIFISTGVYAQTGDEIIVTGSRIAQYESDTVPVIHLKRRADYMTLELSVESDSRDSELRREEIFKTLEALADRAKRNDKIELALLRTYETDDDEIQYVTPFDASRLNDALLNDGYRADTSYTTLVIKTPISNSDDQLSAHTRLKDFVESTPKTGRALIDTSESGLSVVNIDQYRAPLLRALAEDNKTVQEIFGDAYRVEISGLEQPVRWRVTGPLDLAIYFPYKSAISPQ